MAVRVGLGIFTGQRPVHRGTGVSSEYATFLDLASVAEESGFDSIWVSEHHGAGDSYLPSLLPLLAAAAARTTKIRLGTAVVLAPLHDPLRLAEDAAVVDLISQGRLLLGVGAGWREEEFRAFGIPLHQRGPRLEEAVEILRLAWTGKRFTYRAKYRSYRDVAISPSPDHDIPIWVGATQPHGLARAGRLGDGYISSLCNPVEFRARVNQVLGSAEQQGRNGDQIDAAILLDAWVGPPTESLDAAYWQARAVYTMWREGRDVPGSDYRLPALPETPPRPDVIGAPDEIALQLQGYVEAASGARNVELLVRLHYPGMTTEEVVPVIETFGRQVIPRLHHWRATTT